jgi:hypothetical protein
MKRFALYVGWSAVLVVAIGIQYVLTVVNATKAVVGE